MNTRADFEALLNASQTPSYRKGFNPGDMVTADVVSTKGEYIILDVGAKQEGILPASEVTDDDGDLTVATGERISVMFVGMQSGSFLFSAKKKVVGVSDRTLSDAFAAQLPIDGTVQAERNGGYEVTVAGRRAFCPYSQISLYRQEGEEYVGRKFTFLITEYGEDDHGMNIVVSRRALLEKEREAEKEKLFAELKEGDTRKGKVTRLAEFGIFVDLGGAEGLIPLRELSWQRDAKPADVAKTGDEVEVMVNSIDPATGRISLSLRNLQVNPWDQFLANYTVGAVLTATIVRIERFGAFAQIMPGVDGLISIGRLGNGRRLMSAREAVTEGQEVEVQIENIDFEKRKIALKPVDHRVAALKPGSLEPGARAEGLVESIQPFGVFVRLSETATGLLHISETGVPKVGSPIAQLERKFAPGSTVAVVVKSVDGNRISLTLPEKWAAEQQASSADPADDPAQWMRENTKKNTTFGSLGSAFDGIKF